MIKHREILIFGLLMNLLKAELKIINVLAVENQKASGQGDRIGDVVQ